MAKCDLSIELIDGDRAYLGGERVRGTVIVRPDGDFNCKGLDISTRWETHGQGNVTGGVFESVNAFQGQWLAGQTYRYDFDLASGTWPPTYHGESLTVEHVVRATAKLPWKFDPTVAHPFRVYVTTAPESGAVPSTARAGGTIGKIIMTLFAGALALVFLLNPFFWCFGAVIALGGGAWWFFRIVLPKRLLGPVEFSLNNPRLTPGETLRAELVLNPKKNIMLNGIALTMTAREICVSGSGTNKTTHTSTVYEERVVVMDAGELQGGREHRFPIEATLPMRPIYSLDLDDNDIAWTAEMRIDIPRWPDWVSQQKFSVVPPSQPQVAAALLPGASETPLASDMAPAPLSYQIEPTAIPHAMSSEDSGVGFAETVNLIWENRESPETIDQLVAAVKGIPMNATLTIDRRSLYPNPDDVPYADPQGTIFVARYDDPPQPVVLYLPASSLTQIAQIERAGNWSGRIQILAYDSQQRRLRVKAEV